MREMTLRFCLGVWVLVMTVPVTRAELQWHWQGDFSEVQQHRLTLWISRTAPHELSHLLLPYVGRSHSRFAEGFASYMQYQVMQRMGVLEQAQVTALYRSRISAAEKAYNQPGLSFDQASVELLRQRQCSTVYWGGAVYFLRVDQRLRDHGDSLLHVIARYVECCRRSFSELQELVQNLDELVGAEIFQDELGTLQTRKGFPPFADLFSGFDP